MFFDEEIVTRQVNYLEYQGEDYISFNCIETDTEYKIPLSEWGERICYSGSINPGGKKPDSIEIFAKLAQLAKKHDIPLEVISDKEKSNA